MAAIDTGRLSAPPEPSGWPGEPAVHGRRRRADAGDSLSRLLARARERGTVPQELLDRYEAARRAFSEISGLIPPGEKSPDDIQRLRILDAVILEFTALERELYMEFGGLTPDAVQTARSALLERLNQPRPPEPAPRPATLMDLLRAGEPMTLRIDVEALSPAGLVAMGQLLHFEPHVRVERIDEGRDGKTRRVPVS